MKAVNLYILTRAGEPETISSFYQVLSGCGRDKRISPHEADSLCALTERLSEMLAAQDEQPDGSWLTSLDGFFFSYVIEHIGKEFDLLKCSRDGEFAVNIELKSEDIGEERIRKQLEQNRYYLSNAVHTIYSFTYVMSSDTLYCLNDRGYMRICPFDELVQVLRRPAFEEYLADGIDRLFRSSDYLISPVSSPEKYLQGQYFLTNQQYSFKQAVLETVGRDNAPVISVTGAAGTGKTLLLFDLAMTLSKKSRVLFVHSGPLRQGHRVIDNRLKNVDIRSAAPDDVHADLTGYSYVLIDEADYLAPDVLTGFLDSAKRLGIPCVLAYDPHLLLQGITADKTTEETVGLITAKSTLSLAFSGNIRINRPVYSFLKTLLNRKDHAGHPDFSCIDVVCADTKAELDLLVRYYEDQGYLLFALRPENTRSHEQENELTAQEYYKVMMVLDRNCRYDESLHLQIEDSPCVSIQLLYEGLSRTRERLCLIVAENRELFRQILSIFNL